MDEPKYYNPHIKEMWLSEVDLDKYPNGFWDVLFKKYAPIEEEFGKDLSNFTKTEITSAYKRQNYKSFETLMVININLKNYTKWAMQHAIVEDGMNHYDDFTHEQLLSCVNQRQLKGSILTRDELLNGIRELNNAVDAFMLLALFEGIRGKRCEELINLTIDDFDFDSKTVSLCSGRTIPVSNELLHWASLTDQELIYTGFNGKTYKLVGTKLIKKTSTFNETKSAENSDRRIYTAVMRSLDVMGYGGMVSQNSLVTSGMIDMINRLAIEYDTSAECVLYTKSLWEQFTGVYPMSEAAKRRFLMKYKDFFIQPD